MTSATLVAACLLDLSMGDPRWLPHPVRMMGRLIAAYEGWARQVSPSPAGQRLAGVVLAIGLPLLCAVIGWLAIELAGTVHAAAGIGVEVLLASTTLAARDLAQHVGHVRRALKSGSLEEARAAVSRIVGRDTAQMSEPEVVRATVETVAESASDGVIAPLLYLALGGAPLALAYKAVSTLDSMVGHRNPHYVHFGWASARLDDAANWIPARITAVLLVAATALRNPRFSTICHAWKILIRDRGRHPSPNSGWPESVMAGALGVRLGGTNVYDGVPQERPSLGDPIRLLTPFCIREAIGMMWVAYGLGVIGLAGLLRL